MQWLANQVHQSYATGLILRDIHQSYATGLCHPIIMVTPSLTHVYVNAVMASKGMKMVRSNASLHSNMNAMMNPLKKEANESIMKAMELPIPSRIFSIPLQHFKKNIIVLAIAVSDTGGAKGTTVPPPPLEIS